MSNRPQGQSTKTPRDRARDGAATRSSEWTKPVLTVYGDVRQLTMGASPGVGDSSNPGILRP